MGALRTYLSCLSQLHVISKAIYMSLHRARLYGSGHKTIWICCGAGEGRWMARVSWGAVGNRPWKLNQLHCKPFLGLKTQLLVFRIQSENTSTSLCFTLIPQTSSSSSSGFGSHLFPPFSVRGGEHNWYLGKAEEQWGKEAIMGIKRGAASQSSFTGQWSKSNWVLFCGRTLTYTLVGAHSWQEGLGGGAGLGMSRIGPLRDPAMTSNSPEPQVFSTRGMKRRKPMKTNAKTDFWDL